MTLSPDEMGAPVQPLSVRLDDVEGKLTFLGKAWPDGDRFCIVTTDDGRMYVEALSNLTFLG